MKTSFPRMAGSRASKKPASGCLATAGKKTSLVPRKSSAEKPSIDHIPSDRESEYGASHNAKRKRLSTESRADKSISTPRKPAPSSKATAAPPTTIRSSKRERAFVNYDMHYHPAGKHERPTSDIFVSHGLLRKERLTSNRCYR